MYTPRDIADYYNQTLNHYQNWWKLDKNLAVHYGIWDVDTKDFQDSLINTNKVLMEIADIKEGERVLDAGCGVGGSAFYLAKYKQARVTGITLSEKQYDYAKEKSKKLGHETLVDFKVEDYTQTSFPNNSFDVIWAIESITSAADKSRFSKEAFRLLKPGGRLIIADYFKASDNQSDPHKLLEKWRDLWSMADFLTTTNYKKIFKGAGFRTEYEADVTLKITPTAKRMYWSYLLGGPLAVIYNTFFNSRKFAKTHYKSGLYQYKALKEGLWNYSVIMFVKTE